MGRLLSLALWARRGRWPPTWWKENTPSCAHTRNGSVSSSPLWRTSCWQRRPGQWRTMLCTRWGYEILERYTGVLMLMLMLMLRPYLVSWASFTSHDIISHHMTSHDITPHDITPHHITSHHITLSPPHDSTLWCTFIFLTPPIACVIVHFLYIVTVTAWLLYISFLFLCCLLSCLSWRWGVALKSSRYSTAGHTTWAKNSSMRLLRYIS